MTTSKRFPNLGDPPFTVHRALVAQDELFAACEGVPAAAISWRSQEVQKTVWKKDTEGYKLASSEIYLPGRDNARDQEVRTLVEIEAHVLDWSFSRLWYYWAASTGRECNCSKCTWHLKARRPIPLEEAKAFNKQWFSEVRVQGYAGGTYPEQDVDCYHIDTVEGLRAFVELLAGQL